VRPCLFSLRETKLEMWEGQVSCNLEIVEGLSGEKQKDGEIANSSDLLKD